MVVVVLTVEVTVAVINLLAVDVSLMYAVVVMDIVIVVGTAEVMLEVTVVSIVEVSVWVTGLI